MPPKKPVKQTPKGKKEPRSVSFFPFLFQKRQLIELAAFSGLYIILFAGLQYCYPAPSTTADTSNYFYCSNIHDFGGYRPIGYSWFLTFCLKFSTGFTFITSFQYLLNAFATLLFLVTVKYLLLKPENKRTYYIYYTFAFLLITNETVLYLTKWLLSDSIYISYTLIWFTTLLWLLHNYKNVFALLIHTVILYLLMKTRYAGLIYPLVTVAVFLWIYRKSGWYVSALSLGVLFLVYNQGLKDNKRLFNVDTFSAFSGWAKANSAVSVLPYVKVDTTLFKDEEQRRLHGIIKQFPDSFYNEWNVFSYQFIWDNKYPGKTYMLDLRQRHPEWDYVKNWVHTGVRLGEYGNFLMKTYPVEYFTRFVIHNFLRFFMSPDDLLTFSEGKEVDKYMLVNFKPGFDKFYSRYNIYNKLFAKFALEKNLITWILAFAAAIAAFIYRKKLKYTNDESRALWLSAIFILFNAGYLIPTYPTTFRFVVFFNIFLLLFIAIVLNRWMAEKKS